jgi:hypothetical protein
MIDRENNSEEKIQIEFERLQKIVEVLRGMGFKVTDRLIRLDILRDGEAGFPIVSDGLDGIRASYTNNGLEIWFTNGFEHADNPRRQEVESKLREFGLV